MIEVLTHRKCMEFAVATEELGSRFYARLAKKFSSNKEIKAIFAQLARDEEVHRNQFKRLLERTPPDEEINLTPETQGYLRAMSISEFFSHHQGPFADVERIESHGEALRKAFEFEKATLGFYRAVEDALGPMDTLSEVIEAEKHHITVLLNALLVDGSKFRSLEDRWP